MLTFHYFECVGIFTVNSSLPVLKIVCLLNFYNICNNLSASNPSLSTLKS